MESGSESGTFDLMSFLEFDECIKDILNLTEAYRSS